MLINGKNNATKTMMISSLVKHRQESDFLERFLTSNNPY